MNKLYTLFLVAVSMLAFTSCMNSFNVQGSSNISTLDGRMLYLKVLADNDFKTLDSCDVVHGQFHFHGSVDSAKMANIFMEDEQLMPIVLEGGDIVVKVDDAQMTVSGTPLNEKLFGFLKEYNQVAGEMDDLVHRHDQAIMDGSDMNIVIPQLQDEQVRLTMKQDSLLTSFVTENFDNVLGPGVFFLTTIGYEFPVFTPWIDDIMSKATENFKNDAYVRSYIEKAKQNEEIMNGMRDDSQSVVPPTVPEPDVAAPTPNELAAPSDKE